jgi:hypothetical protein
MADIYSIFSGSRISADNSDYNDRFAKCINNVKQYGICECLVCCKKRELAYNAIALINKDLFKYMVDNKKTMYYEDILETLLIGARQVYRHIHRDDENGPKKQ